MNCLGKCLSVVVISSGLIGQTAYGQNVIVPDNTLGAASSTVNPVNNRVDLIEGGAVLEQNWFHSFESLSVGDGQAAYFLTPDGSIANIFTRVTGNAPSDILGTLGVLNAENFDLAATNLYLMNPNGIVFGENGSVATLGAFTATTADAIEFGQQGMFSAVDDSAALPLLTVDPSAFLFTSSDIGPISSRSTAPTLLTGSLSGLWNLESITLLGGDIIIDGGNAGGGLSVPGGNVYIGAIAQPGRITRSATGQLQVLDRIARANVLITDQATLDTAFLADNSIEITAENITIQEGSTLSAGVSDASARVADSPTAGDIVLDATNDIIIKGDSRIVNDVDRNSRGNSGSILISGNSFSLDSESVLGTSSRGQGNAGRVSIDADTVAVNDSSLVVNRIYAEGQGTAEGIYINADEVRLEGGGLLSSALYGEGQGGDIVIDAAEQVFIQNGERLSGIFSTLEDGSFGTGGSIFIATPNLNLIGRTYITTSILGGFGDPRGINIGGDINISASDITIDAEDSFFNFGIFSSVEQGGTGDSGDINIETERLNLLDNAYISTKLIGIGRAGDINITAQAVRLASDNPRNDLLGSSISSEVGVSFQVDDIFGGYGNAGNIFIETESLELRDRADLNSSSSGSGIFDTVLTGDAGNVTVVSDNILLDTSNVRATSTFRGDAGNVNIETGRLVMTEGTQVSAFSSAFGAAGSIVVQARDTVELSGANPSNGKPTALFTDNDEVSRGMGGRIDITSDNFRLLDRAIVDARTRNSESGGDISITATNIDVLGGAQVITESRGAGAAGSINIDATGQVNIAGINPNYAARALERGVNEVAALSENSGLFVRSQADGAAGDINVTTPRLNLSDTGQIIADSFSGSGGNINIDGFDIFLLRRGGRVSTDAGTQQTSGDGGVISILSPDGFIVAIPNENSDISANAFSGNGGSVDIVARGVFGLQPQAQLTPESDITASSTLGVRGSVVLNSPDNTVLQNSLAELSDELATPEQVLSDSCISRSRESGTFVVTGSGGLTESPDTLPAPSFSLGSVRLTQDTAAVITEPQALYRLADGRLIMSRECS